MVGPAEPRIAADASTMVAPRGRSSAVTDLEPVAKKSSLQLLPPVVEEAVGTNGKLNESQANSEKVAAKKTGEQRR